MTDNISRETIHDEAIDPDFIDEIVEAGADRIRTCIQCGTCSSVCPSGRRTAFRTRELMRKALLGLKDEVLSSPDLWLCATCLTCLERCPRQIKVTDAIIIMRNMAVEEGYMLPEHRKSSKKLLVSRKYLRLPILMKKHLPMCRRSWREPDSRNSLKKRRRRKKND